MAQPRAQPAEDLVALDAWVRGGGHVLLLADPMLEWPSERPLGDPLRPPPMFADTGLLVHWGLRLDAPDQRGAAAEQLGGERIADRLAGVARRRLRIAKDWLVAHCRIGKGRATIVADADFSMSASCTGRAQSRRFAWTGELFGTLVYCDSDYAQSYPQGRNRGTSPEHSRGGLIKSRGNPRFPMNSHEKPSKTIVSRRDELPTSAVARGEPFTVESGRGRAWKRMSANASSRRCERGVVRGARASVSGQRFERGRCQGPGVDPAFLRGVIERRGDARTVVLAKHEGFPCLSAYDPAYAALKHAKLERLLEKEETNPDSELEYQQRNLMAFAATEEVPYDSSGRILMPLMMRRKGEIGDLALFRHRRDVPDLEPAAAARRQAHPR